MRILKDMVGKMLIFLFKLKKGIKLNVGNIDVTHRELSNYKNILKTNSNGKLV